MKKVKYLIFSLLFIGLATLSACKKEDMSNYVTKDELNTKVSSEINNVETAPKVEKIDLTIKPYQWTWNTLYKCWEYNYAHSSIHSDVLVGFVMNGQGKQALPYLSSINGTTYGLVDESFSGTFRITYYDGTTSLQKPNGDVFIYLRIIPSSGLKPNVDLSNYTELEEAYGLKSE